MPKLEYDFKAATPETGRRENGIDVSSYGEYPYTLFSPFSYSPDYQIPVPGQDNEFACSVESIWQGLKLINGSTDFRLFGLRPRKRKGIVQGHLLGSQVIGLVEARKEIYMPSYFFHVQKNVPQEIKDNLLEKALTDDVLLYDVEENLDIDDDSSPLAHSVFLAMFLNQYKDGRLDEIQGEIEKAYSTQEQEHETLAEPLVRGAELFGSLSGSQKALAIYILGNPPLKMDVFHKRYYGKLLEKVSR